MLFNSLDFAIFLPIVFLLYWSIGVKNIRAQNILLVIASYFFYSWWDWRFLLLILISTLVDYTVGILIPNQKKILLKKLLLLTSIVVNIGLLGFFKYFNFFLENFSLAFSFVGNDINISSLNIVLPVGISFYTFQTMSYTIDVYRGKLQPTKNIIAFSAFVCFFPQLVAGPIERATNLLPQFIKIRMFDVEKFKDGLRQIIWGLFKKIVIADNCAKHVNTIFENYEDYSGSTLILGGILFAFQIYGDFSGYSDIAIGTSRLFGFNLKQNFAFPYFSRDIAEFWRRWHISLSTWFRDYLYIPLGGSRVSKYKIVRNIFIIFIVSGFWHGANWTFVFWGALNALYFLPLLILKKNRDNLNTLETNSFFPSVKVFFQIVITFSLTIIAWIFFRSDSISGAFEYLSGIVSISIFSFPEVMPYRMIPFFLIFFTIEWIQRDKKHAMEFIDRKTVTFARWTLYLIIIFSITMFFGKENSFIYFQF